MNSVADLWKGVLSLLSDRVSQIAVNTWFKDCEAVDLTENKFILHTSTPFMKNLIDVRFSEHIRAILRDLLASDVDVVLLDDDEYARYQKMNEHAEETVVRDNDADYTFDSFIIGPSNKFAHAAALAVAKGAAKKDYNPLFIYGDSGLGKTHLLRAIRNEIRKNHPEFNIVYVQGDEFTNELIAAIQTGKNIEFREKYRNADLFLMDDVHYIAGKESTQEEFFHTFNTLYENNRQIVFTSDREPKEILRLTDRLKTRFESGLLADIQPPDYETRAAIINRKCGYYGFTLEPDVVDYIAANLTSNVRQLEGAINKIKAYSDLMGAEITVPLVTKILKDMFKEKSSLITPDIIIEETAKYYSLTPEDLKGPSRVKIFVFARQIAMYLIRTLTNFSLSDIGNVFDRDHTTVMNALRQVEKNVRTNEETYKVIRSITANINARS